MRSAILAGCCAAIASAAPVDTSGMDAIVSPTAMNYADALRYCQAQGRRLPVVETEAQLAALRAKCLASELDHDCTWLAMRCPLENAGACADKNSWFWMNAIGQKTSALASSFDLASGYVGGMPVAELDAAVPGYCARWGPAVTNANILLGPGFNAWTRTLCTDTYHAVCERPSGELSVGSEMDLPVGFNKVTAMAADEAFVYACTYTGQLVKMNQLNIKDFGVLNLGTRTGDDKYTDLGALVVDATHVYVTGMQNGQNKLIKIGKGSMAVEATFSLTQAENIAYAVLERDAFLYLGLYTFPGQVVKVAKSTMQQEGSVQLPQGANDVRSMEWDRSNPDLLFANTNTEPGMVAKINIKTMSVVGTPGMLSVASGESKLLAGCDQDADHVVVATGTSPARVVRVRKSDLARTAHAVLQENEDMAIAIDSDYAYTYAGLYTTPAKIVRMRNADLTEAQTLVVTSAAQVTAMAKPAAGTGASDKLYAGTDTSPARIFEVVGLLQGVDCSVSEWSEWTTCTKSCGGGLQSRSRQVMRPAANGGASCPEKLADSRICNEYTTCPKQCKDGMVWTFAGTMPRPTCNSRSPQVAGQGIAMCACPPDRPYWHNHGICVSQKVCNDHVHSTICTHIKCQEDSGVIKAMPVEDAAPNAQPFHCEHRAGRMGGCICMCNTGATAPPPTPPPQPCYEDSAHYEDVHQIGGVVMSVTSAALCQRECVSLPLCHKWSYQGAGKACYLFDPKAALIGGKAGFISGPKVCPLDQRMPTEFGWEPRDCSAQKDGTWKNEHGHSCAELRSVAGGGHPEMLDTNGFRAFDACLQFCPSTTVALL